MHGKRGTGCEGFQISESEGAKIVKEVWQFIRLTVVAAFLFLTVSPLMANTSELAALRDAITAKLAASSDFSGITVLSRKTGDLANEIERSLAELGVYASVIFSEAQPKNRQSQRPVLDPVKFQVRCVADRLINSTGKDAEFLAERALAILQWWTPDANDVPGGYMLQPVPPGIREIFIIGKPGDEKSEDLEGFDVFFETKLALTPAT